MGPALIAEATTGATFSTTSTPMASKSVAHGMGMPSMVNEPLYEIDALNPAASGCTPGWPAGTSSRVDGEDAAAARSGRASSTTMARAMTANDVAKTFALMKLSRTPTQRHAGSVLVPDGLGSKS